MTYKGKHTTSECIVVWDFYSLVLPKRVGPWPVVASHPKEGNIRLSVEREVFLGRISG